jgi:hypothetical protein
MTAPAYYMNRDYPFFNQEYTASQFQVQENFDDYFANNYQNTFVPQNDPVQAARFITETTESSGSNSPDVANYYHNNYANQGWKQDEINSETHQVYLGNLSKEPSQYSTTQGEKAEESDEDDEESETPGKGGIMQYKSVLNSKIWDEEMDQLLLKLGSQYKCNWKKIANKYNHKKITSQFIKMRYKDLTYAAPITRRIKFTHQEDLMIAKYFDKYGSNWSEMSQFFQDRSAIMLKNRYYSFIRKRDVMDILLSKAREIESNGVAVDSLNTPESQKYTENMDLTKENYNCMMQIPIQQNQERHVIFGYEERVRNELRVAPVERKKINDKDEEIKILKARIKALQSLYLKTRGELAKFKDQN